MKSTFNLRLPEELCGKIESEAAKNHLSINQYILYTLTKTVMYNEALDLLNSKLESVSNISAMEILNRVPDREPLEGDEI